LLNAKSYRALASVLTLVAVIGLVAGCSSRKVVTRVDENEQIDLSGNWNDTDSRQMAATLVEEMMTGTAWVENHLERAGNRPAVIVGDVRNKTAEHIPMKTLMADLEKSFINSGRVKVVASAEEREGVRAERADQQEFASPESMARWGRELGADYMLLGELNAIFDREEGEEVKYYQLDCYLVDLEDNTKVWVGDDRIKKYIGRSKYKP
jgi:uncharacterized protein (TIGR02722 family)